MALTAVGLALCLSVAAGYGQGEPGPLKVGIATTLITPEGPVWLGGFSSRKEPTKGEVYKDLVASCLVFDNGQTRVGLMAVDMINIHQQQLDDIRDAAEKVGIPRHQMMVNHSHTHCGPSLHGKNPDFVAQFKTETCALPQKAVDDLEEARLDFTVGTCAMGINRRQIGPDGKCIGMRPDPRGPIDTDVPVLRVLSPTGEVRAVVFGYACHPTTMGGMKTGPDFPGYARDWVAAAYGEGCQPVFLQGCGGDIKPRYVKPRPPYNDPNKPSGRFGYVLLEEPLDTVKEVGHELGRAVVCATCVPPPAVTGTELGGASAMLDLPTKKDPEKSIQKEIQVLRIGNVYVVGMNDEILVDIGLRIKRELGAEEWFAGAHAWVNGYTNRRQLGSYVPAAATFPEEGYEVKTSRVGPGAEDILVGKAIELTKGLCDAKWETGE